MSRASQTALAALARFNDAHPWSHNDAYAAVVLHHARRVRAAGGTEALDVGCGTGNLVRRLADVFPAVTGIERDVPTAELARRTTADLANVSILTQPFDEFHGSRYDLITFVAVLHHLPLEATLEKVRELLRPGGRLVVVGVSREAPADLPWSIASMILNPIVGIAKSPRGSQAIPTHMTAPTAMAAESFEQIALAAKRILPGARIGRSLFWRYRLSWTAPGPR
ncbi:class I SAM-dependent methyltransferase [Kribbella sindirgiensis]|uniref:Class I SAM-dependent methyltransferase n=1 Tax=Kribbella sindirgiensis TaxID=1124744 RepID=A0A4R0HXN0_9ACTN|nr:class I SAM-dependent methyltransferase [Kribbella sindirgiensis]TCC16272.1 class I SAM-dependent methyltransferase [Kribbella sindirgiensis]